MVSLNAAEQLTKLPAQPFAAILVLRLIDDENASLAEVGRLVEMDPALSARVIRLANSPYYGLRTGVNSASRAVILLGVSAVRAVVAAAASCLLSDDVTLGPDDYWAHSVAVAAASAVAAAALEVAETEAFSAGLLHDIGSALLHRGDAARYDRACAECGDGGLLEMERAVYGVTHAQAGAEALASWHFPKTFVQAVATHHDPVTTVNPLAQAVVLGEALAERLDPIRTIEGHRDLEETIALLGLELSGIPGLLERTRRQIAEIQGLIGADK